MRLIHTTRFLGVLLTVFLAPLLLALHCRPEKTADTSRRLSDFDIQLPEPDSDGCAAPRPANIGCSVVCKPCFIWNCEGGRWEREQIDWDAEMCGSAPGGDRPRACPRDENNFCPAECSICF
jgi:hypothetical protein